MPKNVPTTVQLHSFNILARFAQNPSSWVSAAQESRTSRGTSWVLKKQKNQRSNCQHLLDNGKSEGIQKKNIYFSFIEYAKAFGCIDHNKLWKILKEMGITDHLTCFLKNLYVRQEATVITRHGTTGTGVWQGCILSSCLVNLLWQVHHGKSPAGWITSWNQDCQEKYQ